MKKLLTILVLALTLCLVCGVALAADYGATYDTIASFEDALKPANSIIAATSGGAERKIVGDKTVTGTVTVKSIKDDKTVTHVEYRYVNVYGEVDTVGSGVWETVIVRVRRDAAHTFTTVDDAKSKDPTCTEGGWIAYKCSVCGLACSEANYKLLNPLGCAYEKVMADFDCGTAVISKPHVATDTKVNRYWYCPICKTYKVDAFGNKVVADQVYAEHTYKKADGTWNLVATKPACDEFTSMVSNSQVSLRCVKCGKANADAADLGTAWNATPIYVSKIGAYNAAWGNPVIISLKNYCDVTEQPDFDGHTYDGKPFDAKAADCDKGASWWERCTNCGYTKQFFDKDSAPLTPIWTLNTKYTCWELYAGHKTDIFVCSICNGKSVAHKNGMGGTVVMAPADDAGNYLGWKITSDDGKLTAYVWHEGIANGNSHYTIAANAAAAKTSAAVTLEGLTEAQKKTFCTTDGWLVEPMKCKVCASHGHNVTWLNVTKVKHDWNAWEPNKDNSETAKYVRSCKICSVIETRTYIPCGEAGSSYEKHNYVPDAATVAAMKCGEKKTDMTFACANPGCGSKKVGEYTRIHVLEAYGNPTKDATCSAPGTQMMKCTWANCSYIEEKEIPATGKHITTLVAGKAATCKDPGKKDYYTCSQCTKLFLDAEGTKVATEADLVIPADEKLHVPSELLAEVKPTCTAEGKKVYTCTVCGKTITEVVEKLPHTWDEGVITKEATKEAKGEKTFTCTVCGETKKEDIEWAASEPAKYTMTAEYDGNTVTGKLVHDDTTVEADVKNIRVTFYIEGNFYMATMAEVAADGTFSVDGVGPIVYITVAATGNTSVNPEAYQKIAEPIEIIVK